MRVFLLLLVLLAIVATPTLQASPGASTRVGMSPHGAPGACATCHAPTSGPSPGAVRPVDATCRSCHADADSHPVNVKPRDIVIAPGFPLENGLVTCATCHAEPSCDAGREKLGPFLRGGTPDRKVEFCNRCHAPTTLQRVDPHHPATPTAEGDPTCAACHSGKPEAAALPAVARLRTAPADACVTCHPGPVHAGAAEHVGKVQAPLSAALAQALPLDTGNRVACWTCHDVHAHGSPAPSTPSPLTVALQRPAAPPATDHPSMLALPAADGTLCRACHGKGP
ncbi:MAG: cytochrome c3 family protein [Myxococcota bacterium]